MRHSRQVRENEQPYKFVKSVALNMRIRSSGVSGNGSGESVKTALFGRWQTDPWQPPAAKDVCHCHQSTQVMISVSDSLSIFETMWKSVQGKVPKNERGNVDLWDDAHLPPGTVHLQCAFVQSWGTPCIF